MYAERQAAMHEQIASGHAQHWLSVLKSFDIEPCWGSKYAAQSAPDFTSTNIDNSDSDTENEKEVKDIEINDNTYDDFVLES